MRSVPITHRYYPNRASLCGVIAVAVFAVAAALAIGKMRESGRRTSCLCHISILSLALRNYESQYGCFPPAYIADSQGRPMHSWRVLILPFLDRADLYDRYRFDEPWDGPNNIKLVDEIPSIFACPSHTPIARQSADPGRIIGLLACAGGPPSGRARRRCTSYAVPIGPHCVFRGSTPVMISEIRDGIGTTLLIGEVTDADIPWTKPEDIDVAEHLHLGDRMGFSSEHDAGVNLSLADGRPRCFPLATPQAIIDALYTRDGGEAVPADSGEKQ